MFGMGTGVTLSTQPPENLSKNDLRSSDFDLWSPAHVESSTLCRQRPKAKDQRPNPFGSGDLAVWACKRLIARTANRAKVRATELVKNPIFDLYFGL